MKDMPAIIHRALYKRSDKPNAPENQNPDWKSGYAVGRDDDRPGTEIIPEEWARRGSPEELPNEFLEWKKGYWAARMQKSFAKV